jgi:hypothetical protein
MELLDFIGQLLDSIGDDVSSGSPGFHTAATVVRALSGRGLGKGRNDTFTNAQIGQIRRLLDEYSEERIVRNGRAYYRGFKKLR